MRIKRMVMVALIGPTLLACTPSERAAWLRWHAVDPAAAVAFAEKLPPEPAPAPRGVWDDLAWCESGGNWSYNGGSGYDGGLQFWPPTWEAYGGNEFADRAWQASREQQIIVAERVLDDVGWGAWPACSRKLGLR
jgi:hypothetical protein